MRLPQVSSKTTAMIEPMFAGSPWNLTPPRLEALDLGGNVLCDEGSGGDPCFKQRFLVHARRRKLHWLQHDSTPRDAVGRGHRKPAKLTHGDVRHLLEAENEGV